MTSTTYKTIREAILAKQNISAEYKNHVREMTPHTLGTKGGKEQCLFYQFGGSSSSATVFPKDSPSNWRCIPLDTLKDVSVIGGDVRTCERHTQRQTCVDIVDVEISL